ncbi:MAG: sugar phosphate nucleotidyltransferase [Candidatus ainarchaeum sp.]|nr:sugar phosphate nucleotidyltransferase [Candidatus ainarchaeum sp.]
MKIIILAGGKGKRLRPYTLVLPKPLLPIDDEPILDKILKTLKNQKVTQIFLSVNYKSYLFKMIYGHGEKFGMNIEYIEEEKPLGTAGPIGLIREKISENLFVTNGDLICNLDLKRVEEFHNRNNCDITVVTRGIETPINFGVLRMIEGKIVDWAEKPKIYSEISAGMYLLNPRILNEIPKNEFFNMPDLVKKIIEKGGKVKGFHYDGEVLDVSNLEEYKKIRRNNKR